MYILLVEDDAVLADGLIHTLERSGYSVSWAATGQYAEQLLLAQDFDLLILDLGLPDIDGLELLRRIRRRKIPLPILILTAREDVNDRIQGIKEGADDYLTKPFELRELEARIHALIRRCYGGFSNVIHFGRLSLDIQTHQILADDQLLTLSSRESSLLEFLLLQAGKVACKERIAQRLSDNGDGIADNAIEVYIHRVRKRIQPYGVMIRTLRGLGYILELADSHEN
jgi:two-component system, OmpR family, response regulator